MTPGGKSMHSKHVEKLKTQITWNRSIFEENPMSFSTGVEIKKEIAGNILKVKELGSAQYKTFVKEWLVGDKQVTFRNTEKEKDTKGYRNFGRR